MNADELRALQATRYRQDPVAASSPFVRAATSPPPTWPAAWTGAARSCGTGMLACAGNMLLDALVACAGVTLKAAATAMNVPVRGRSLRKPHAANAHTPNPAGRIGRHVAPAQLVFSILVRGDDVMLRHKTAQDFRRAFPAAPNVEPDLLLSFSRLARLWR